MFCIVVFFISVVLLYHNVSQSPVHIMEAPMPSSPHRTLTVTLVEPDPMGLSLRKLRCHIRHHVHGVWVEGV